MKHPVRPTLPERPGVLVVSHERSGTHFLMNALAGAFHYRVQIDVEPDELPGNYYLPPDLLRAIAGRAAYQPYVLFKSHHAAEFFDGIFDELLKSVVILYIHRHPVDVMVSFWRLIHGFHWREGPKTATALDFARAEPEGQMLRYQMHQRRNMLDRWARHVEGWIAAAQDRPRLMVVRYDALLNDYEQTLRSLAPVLGVPSGSFQRPPRDRYVIKGAAAESLPEPDRDALHALALAEVGNTMRAFEYE